MILRLCLIAFAACIVASGQQKEQLRDLVVVQRAVIFRGSGITQGS